MLHPLVRGVLVLCCALSLATAILWILVTLHPTSNDSHGEDKKQLQLQFPTTISELQQLVSMLQDYKDSHNLYLLTLFSAAYIYKQTFAIPGSALMNVLAGALFGVWVSVPLVCILTAMGASCCFILSQHSLALLLLQYQQRRVTWLRQQVSDSQGSLLLLLVSLRIFPGTPNWFLNMAAPVAGVPLSLFMISVFIGLAPYNTLCVAAGASVSRLRSVADLWSGEALGCLAALAAAAYAASRLVASQTRIETKENRED